MAKFACVSSLIQGHGMTHTWSGLMSKAQFAYVSKWSKFMIGVGVVCKFWAVEI